MWSGLALSMAERKAVTKEMALRYRQGPEEAKGRMLDKLCALTGWHPDYARRALRSVAARPPLPRGHKRALRARTRRPPVYDAAVVAALGMVWALLDFPCGKRLAAAIGEVAERHGEMVLDAEVKAKLLAVSAAATDRRLPPTGAGPT